MGPSWELVAMGLTGDEEGWRLSGGAWLPVGGVWGVGGRGLAAGGESPGDGPSLVWLL